MTFVLIEDCLVMIHVAKHYVGLSAGDFRWWWLMQQPAVRKREKKEENSTSTRWREDGLIITLTLTLTQ
jgi:hypothetical protein